MGCQRWYCLVGLVGQILAKLLDHYLLFLLLYIIKLIEPSAMKLINIQKDSSDVLAGQIFRLT